MTQVRDFLLTKYTFAPLDEELVYAWYLEGGAHVLQVFSLKRAVDEDVIEEDKDEAVQVGV